MSFNYIRTLLVAITAASAFQMATPTASEAAATDYRFEADQPIIKSDAKAIVTVHLIHLPDGKPIPDAVISGSKLAMQMAGSMPMAGSVVPLKADGHGGYLFQANLSAAGDWTLVLIATVSGEPETITSAVKLKVQ